MKGRYNVGLKEQEDGSEIGGGRKWKKQEKKRRI